ncbi:MAG: hypothetical protein A2654_01445 [Candidatus Nealsonbacteria bacterium RIFCSPHIGHO2_01_FULL_43_31]|uniref:Uncharacterized protein n=1 Tax=Candidatus Nealsonbacteria bacterium RIFCSPHIGHO2_01_FULL_43_31 TaxID=1801665 RepID=A0A1G2E3Z9_9BACT|nr:MAG: hypothetical protein A2654_01445 [Candidatus Nealsonbacteria bacterium RIFCSPHIGHO2_01_FULL_43_31]
MKPDFRNQGYSLIGIIIVLLSVSLISGGLYYYLQKQTPQIKETETVKNTEDLTAFFIPSEGINGLSSLEEAEKILKVPSPINLSEILDQILKQDKISNEAEIKKVIDDNSQSINLVKQASSASYLQVPEYDNLEKIKAAIMTGATPRSMGNWRTLAKLVAIKAFLEAQQGQDAKAVEDLFVIIRLGHLIQNANNGIMGYLNGQNMKINGVDMLYKLIGDEKLGIAVLKEIPDSLKEYEDMTGEKLPSQLKEQYNTIIAQYYRDYVSGAKADNYSQYAEPDYISSIKDPTLKSLLDIVLINGSSMIQQRFLQKFYIEGISLLVSLRLNDILPDSLPRDPFSGNPLRYDKDKKILYSVGPSGQDKGGTSLVQPAFFTELKEMENPSILLSP